MSTSRSPLILRLRSAMLAAVLLASACGGGEDSTPAAPAETDPAAEVIDGAFDDEFADEFADGFADGGGFPAEIFVEGPLRTAGSDFLDGHADSIDLEQLGLDLDGDGMLQLAIISESSIEESEPLAFLAQTFNALAEAQGWPPPFVSQSVEAHTAIDAAAGLRGTAEVVWLTSEFVARASEPLLSDLLAEAPPGALETLGVSAEEATELGLNQPVALDALVEATGATPDELAEAGIWLPPFKPFVFCLCDPPDGVTGLAHLPDVDMASLFYAAANTLTATLPADAELGVLGCCLTYYERVAVAAAEASLNPSHGFDAATAKDLLAANLLAPRVRYFSAGDYLFDFDSTAAYNDTLDEMLGDAAALSEVPPWFLYRHRRAELVAQAHQAETEAAEADEDQETPPPLDREQAYPDPAEPGTDPLAAYDAAIDDEADTLPGGSPPPDTPGAASGGDGEDGDGEDEPIDPLAVSHLPEDGPGAAYLLPRAVNGIAALLLLAADQAQQAVIPRAREAGLLIAASGNVNSCDAPVGPDLDNPDSLDGADGLDPLDEADSLDGEGALGDEEEPPTPRALPDLLIAHDAGDVMLHAFALLLDGSLAPGDALPLEITPDGPLALISCSDRISGQAIREAVAGTRGDAGQAAVTAARLAASAVPLFLPEPEEEPEGLEDGIEDAAADPEAAEDAPSASDAEASGSDAEAPADEASDPFGGSEGGDPFGVSEGGEAEPEGEDAAGALDGAGAEEPGVEDGG